MQRMDSVLYKTKKAPSAEGSRMLFRTQESYDRYAEESNGVFDKMNKQALH